MKVVSGTVAPMAGVLVEARFWLEVGVEAVGLVSVALLEPTGVLRLLLEMLV